MKKIILLFITLIFISFKGYTQNKEIEASLFIRGNEVRNVKYYLIKDDKAYLQKYKNNKIILKDTLSNQFQLLAIYKNHKILVPIVRFNEVESLNIYYDNRIFNNLIRKKYRRPFFKHLFKKDYLIDLGLDDVYTTFKLKSRYELIN